MIIKEIELNNFKIYYGVNRIDLTPESHKNMVIISGQNGFGKTTFLMALVWCLYGKQMGSVDELYDKAIKDKKTYGNYISNSLNRTAKEKGRTKFSVSITFTNFPEESGINANVVKIERIYDTKSGIEELKILFDGKPNEEWELLDREEAKKEKEFFIRGNVVALEAAKFFFFDAERIVAFANSSKAEQSSLLGESFSQVLGIQRYIDLKEQLEKILDEYKGESGASDVKSLYMETISLLEQNEEKRVLCEENIKTYSSQRDFIVEKQNALTEKIVREGDVMSDDELEELRQKENNLKETMSGTQTDMSDVLKLLPFGICGALLSDVIQQVELEKDYKQYKLKTENIDERTYDLLNDLEEKRYESGIRVDMRIHEFYTAHIKTLLRKYFSGTPEEEEEFQNFELVHDMAESDANGLKILVSKVKSSRAAFANIYYKYNQAKAEVAAIRQKIAEAEQKGDSALLQMLKKEKEENEVMLEEAIAKCSDAKRSWEDLKGQKKELLQKKENLGKLLVISEKNSKYNSELTRLVGILNKFIHEFKNKRIQSLEDKIITKLQSLLHKKELIDGVNITMLKDGIDISIRDKHGRKIDQQDLSMGERQMLSTAILASLEDETGTNFPVFIDSPLQKFDTKHTESILRKFYPNVSDQVIIFPLLRKELTEMEYEIIKSNVAKAFIIQNSSEGSSFKAIDKDKLFDYE